MRRNTKQTDFVELVVWGLGAFAFYKIFGKNEPLVGQEYPNTTNDIYNLIDWKQGYNETNVAYLQRTTNEMRKLNNERTFTSQDELDQYIAYTAKVWGEKFKGKVSYAWKYQLYAKHAFILHGKYYDERLKQNMYQVAEMLNGPSLNRVYSEKQLKEKSIHTILRVGFSR